MATKRPATGSPSTSATRACSVQRLFTRRKSSIRAVRDFVADALTACGCGQRLDDVRLCVSELATNALLHGAPSGRLFAVRVTVHDTSVRIEVQDSGDGTPARRSPASGEERGRGLLRVDALADDWGVAPRTVGKTVWMSFELPAESTGIGSRER